MLYVLKFKKVRKWRLYRNNKKIKIFKDKLNAENEAKKLQEDSKFQFKVDKINEHPKFRESALFGSKWEE